MGMKMFLKGRMDFLPHNSRDRAGLRKMLDRLKGGR